MAGTNIKTFAGVSRIEVSGEAICLFGTEQYVQFPAGVGGKFGNKELPIADTITYNETSVERESMMSQQGRNVGFSESHMPPFLEGTFFLTYDQNGDPITKYLHDHIDVTITATNRAGHTITLNEAHATRVDDVDMVSGTYSCRWEGRNLETSPTS